MTPARPVASDDVIAAEFEKGLRFDREDGIIWREMKKSEQPRPSDLLQAMSEDDRNEAARLLGFKYVERHLMDTRHAPR